MLKFSNFGKAIIGSAPTGTTGLNFTVEAGKGVNFPALDAGDYFYGIFKDASGNREIVKIEARSGDAMTIAVGGRGLDGTTARTWNAGDYFVAGLTNVALQESLSNANLTALGALVSAADKIAYWTGAGTAALTTITAFIRSLFVAADATAARATLKAAGVEGDETIAGNKTFSGNNTHSGANIFSGNNTHSGTSTFAGNLVMSGKPILYAGVSVETHATACNIWVSNYVSLTGGAVNFTNFAPAPQAGCEVELYCNQTNTFTNNANIGVEGGTQTVEAGDRVKVRALSTTVFRATIIKNVPFASGPERIAGASASRIVTPSALAYGNNASANGLIWHAGGIMENWGTVPQNFDIGGSVEISINFASPFPNESFVVIPTCYSTDSGSAKHIYATLMWHANWGFGVRVVETASVAQSGWGIKYIAKGR